MLYVKSLPEGALLEAGGAFKESVEGGIFQPRGLGEVVTGLGEVVTGLLFALLSSNLQGDQLNTAVFFGIFSQLTVTRIICFN